jgi:hypothetical protein
MSIQHIPTTHTIGELWPVMVNQLAVRAAHNPGEPDALDGDMTIEALPTWYADTVFRSALEASWAATLDSLRIAWEYEPETITLPSGAVYIPDFRLPDIGAWLEVKGPGVPRIEKAHELGATRACTCTGTCSCAWPGGELVLIGHIPDPCADTYDDGAPLRVLARRAIRHGGHPAWSSAHGPRAYLGRCLDCGITGFSTLGPVACRACRGRWAGAYAHRTGDPGLRFLSPTCRPAPAAPPTA